LSSLVSFNLVKGKTQRPPFTIGKIYVLLSREAQHLLSWPVALTCCQLLMFLTYLRASAVMSHPAPYIAEQYYCHPLHCVISQYFVYFRL